MKNEYIINGIEYHKQTRYLPEDELHEVSLVGPGREVWIATYGDTKSEAYQEMEDRLQEKGITGDKEEYQYHPLSKEDRRKIQVKAKGIKTELYGEWMTPEERWEKFQRIMKRWTESNYGHQIPFTKSEYDTLY